VQTLWGKDIAPKWKERHARATALKDKLSSIEQAAAATTADVDRLWDKAVALLDLEGGKAATPLLQQILTVRRTMCWRIFIWAGCCWKTRRGRRDPPGAGDGT